MALFDWLVFFAALLFLGRGLEASSGELHPIYKACVEKCEKIGCIKDQCFENFDTAMQLAEGPWYLQELFYVLGKEWDCRIDCWYYCMLLREEERQRIGDRPFTYHGQWHFKHLLDSQDSLYVALLSTVNVALIFHGWSSFFTLVYYKLPLRLNGKTYYEYTGLWHIYAILSMNSWFWSAVFHARKVNLIERLYCSSTLVFLGFELIVAIIRTLNVRTEAARVMVSAPLIAFITTHILYLNLVEFNRELNLVVVVIISTAKLLFWAMWAGLTGHPSRRKLWTVLVGSALGMIVEILDFPSFRGLVDSQALWQAIASPLSYIWWSVIRDDAVFTTSTLIKKKAKYHS